MMAKQLEASLAGLGEEQSQGRSCLAPCSIKAMGTSVNSEQAGACPGPRSVSILCQSCWVCADTTRKCFKGLLLANSPEVWGRPRI